MSSLLEKLENAVLTGVKLEADEDYGALFVTYIYGEDNIGGIEIPLCLGEPLLRHVCEQVQGAWDAKLSLPDPSGDIPLDVPISSDPAAEGPSAA
jgi:hypothetical protein